MRRFRFRLERVLSMRRLRAQMLQQRVAVARAALRAAEQQLIAATAAYRDASDSLCQQEAAGVTAGLLRHGRLHLGHLAETVAAGEGAVKAAQAALQTALHDLAKAQQAEKALERLRERRWLEYRREALKREQAQLDELTVTRVGWEALP